MIERLRRFGHAMIGTRAILAVPHNALVDGHHRLPPIAG